MCLCIMLQYTNIVHTVSCSVRIRIKRNKEREKSKLNLYVLDIRYMGGLRTISNIEQCASVTHSTIGHRVLHFFL